MTEKEKENRIHSFALSFLGRQQIIPNLYADQIIRGYKEGYHQAEKDLKVKEVGEPTKDLEKEIQEVQRNYKTIEEYKGYPCTMYADNIEWIAKHFYEHGLKAKGE